MEKVFHARKFDRNYEFEDQFNILFKKFGSKIYQGIIGKIPKSKNERKTILTSMGDISFPNKHPLATTPGGFKISPYLQEHLPYKIRF